DIWVLPMDGGAERKPVSFLHSEFNELHGQLSPDSHWMAYTSDASGQREVYVRDFPGRGRKENFDRGGRTAALARRWEGTVFCGGRLKDDGRSGKSHGWTKTHL